MTPLQAAWLALFCFIIIVEGPFFVWCFVIVRKDWNCAYIVKRGRSSVCLALLTVTWIQYVFEFSFIVSFGFYPSSNGASIFFEFAVYPTLYLVSIATIVFVFRFWLFYYNNQLNRIYQNSTWRMAIDPNNEPNNNWFVKYSKTLGNSKYLFKMACIIGVIFGIYASILFEMKTTESYIIGDVSFAVFFVISGIFGLFCFIKLKYNTTDDNLGIRKELIEMVIVFPTWTICLSILNFLPINQDITNLIRHIGLSSLAITVIIITIIIPHLRSKYKEVSSNVDNNNENQFNAMTSNSNSPHDTRNTSVNIFGGNSWEQVVSDLNGFESFMNHLEKEFSMENLLFIQEYVQIKSVLKEHFKEIMDKLANKSKFGRFNVELPPTSPNSKQKHTVGDPQNKMVNVTNKNDNNNANNGELLDPNGNRFTNPENIYIPESIMAQELRNKMIENNESNNDLLLCESIVISFESLFNKYIDSQNATFEINIASGNRTKWIQLFDRNYFVRSKQTRMQRFSIHSSMNNGNNDKNKNKMNGIRDELKKRLKQNDRDNSNGHNDDAISWLLETIIFTVEPSVYEISSLMNDSFSRYPYKHK